MKIQRILKKLTEEGFKQTVIAKEAKTSKQNISRIINGGEPSYTLGKAIEDAAKCLAPELFKGHF